MNQFTFMNVNSGNQVTHTFTAEGISDVIDHFEQFLRGCGYSFNGALILTGDDE